MYTNTAFILEALLALPILLLYWPYILIRTLFAHSNSNSASISSSTTPPLVQYNVAKLQNQIVIVTGSNTGIGKATAMRLYGLGAKVMILACRDVKKGNEAREEIIMKKRDEDGDVNDWQSSSADVTNNKQEVVVLSLDLGSFRSIIEFVIEVKRRYDRVDILVNNAGLNQEGTTIDGLQQLFQVNYLGHYLLVRLLFGLYTIGKEYSESMEVIPNVSFNSRKIGKQQLETLGFSHIDLKILQRKPPIENARIVNLSSVMHHTGSCDFEASSLPRAIAGRAMKGKSFYNDSKLYMNLMTYELNKRYSILTDTGHPRQRQSGEKSTGDEHVPIGSLLAVSANPGAVRSDIWRHVPRPVMAVYDYVMKMFFLSVEQGAATSVFGATVPSDEIEDLSRRARNLAWGSQDQSLCKTTFNCWLPYTAPYRQPLRRIGFEMLGPFAGADFEPCTIPANIGRESAELWKYSEELCNKMLLKQGVPSDCVKLDGGSDNA